MDSLTQIVLGAAVGEVILGKKIGNRALLWGAVGGTIPDLDVLSSFFVSEINELAYHRGFSHSIVFSIIGAFGFGWLGHRLYLSKSHKYWAFAGWFAIPLGIILFMNRIFNVSNSLLIGLSVLCLPMGYYLYKKYFLSPYDKPSASLRDWQWLFFGSLVTHPLLDCFTTYGTQLFQPFSDYRVAFNAVSVADPIYTLPFLICVILLSFYARQNNVRRKLAWTGIIYSSCYLLFTVVNKTQINQVWEQSLEESNVPYQRYMSSPTILNNILWYCLAETEEGYYYGLYSIFDKEKKVVMTYTPRNQDLINPNADDHTINVIKWFSNGYYNVIEKADGSLQMNDLRFGTFDSGNSGEQTYIFGFPIQKKEDGYYQLTNTQSGPPEDSRQEMLRSLWQRIKGQ